MRILITWAAGLLLAFYSNHVLAEGSGRQVWAFSMDNDLFVPGSVRDVDFTGGFALTYSGRKGLVYWQGLDDSRGRWILFLTRTMRIRP